MDALARALHRHSPRYSPVRIPWTSRLIHLLVLVVWAALFGGAFWFHGGAAWGVGVAYAFYDTVLLVFVAWQLRSLVGPAGAGEVPGGAMPAGAGPSLAVLVAAHNEASVLPLMLDALHRQAGAPDTVVIADDGSNDGTVEMLRDRFGLPVPPPGGITAPGASAAWPRLRWLRAPKGGKARALNAAAAAIDDDVVLTVDADTLLEPGAIQAFRRAFTAEPALVAATGVLVPVCGRSAGARAMEWFQTYEYVRNFVSRYAWMRADGLLLISGAFAGFRRQPLLAVGGFDPDCLVEDYELIHRLRRAAPAVGAWSVRVLGDAQARTDAPGGVRAFLRQRQRWFGGFLQTQYWYRAMVGDGRLGNLGRWMLPVKAIDTLQPLYGLTAFGLLLYYLVTARLGVLGLVALVIGVKIAIDLVFHAYAVVKYRRWLGLGPDDPQGQGPLRRRPTLGPALAAAVVEPFSFQLLRHVGAALGWWAFLSGRRGWSHQARQGLLAATDASPESPARQEPKAPTAPHGLGHDPLDSRARPTPP